MWRTHRTRPFTHTTTTSSLLQGPAWRLVIVAVVVVVAAAAARVELRWMRVVAVQAAAAGVAM
jgi:hypothetical protein